MSDKIKISEKDLKSFFDSVDINVSEELKNRSDFQKKKAEKNLSVSDDYKNDQASPTSTSSENKGPNILYLTTECNLACEYCYEKKEREALKKQRVMSKKDISNALEKILEKWKKDPSSPQTVVIFGGEPFLEPQSIKYILDRSLELNKDAFAFCLTTNGLWFLKENNIETYKQWTKDRTISLEVSWDGSGNFRRIYKNNKTASTDIEKALNNLEKHNVLVTLRYTIHAGNYDKVISDYIYALEKWKNIKKIQNSYDFEALDKISTEKNITGGWYNLIYKKLNYKEYYRAIWNKYRVPLCQEVCDLCDYCDKTLDEVVYFNSEGNVLVKTADSEGKVQNKHFDHWAEDKK